MNKEWFIFKGSHHIGPYTPAEMEDFFRSGEINAQSLVWREGAEKWEALSKTSELQFIFNSPTKKPQLPDLPEIPEDMPPAPPELLMSNDDEDLPPPIPLDAILNPEGKKPIFKSKVSFWERHSQKMIFGSLLALFLVVLAWFYMNEQSSSIDIRVRGLMPVYHERLQETASLQSPGLSMTMALSLDGKTLYAASNKSGEIITIIKLRSISKRILGVDDVELIVRGVMKDHLGEYARMQLTKGAQFVPGEYEIDFTGRRLHFLNRQFKFLNAISFFKKLNSTYTHKTTALIYAGTPREFEKKLAEYRETIVNERLKPFNDKLERLQTLQSLLNQTMEDYLLSLDKISKPKGILAFERRYIKEVSPIVQSLVLAADDLYKKNEMHMEDTRHKIAPYQNQVQFGKLLGEMASDMITQTGSLKKLTGKDKMALKAKFEARYKTIKTQIQADTTLLEAEIKKIID